MSRRRAGCLFVPIGWAIIAAVIAVATGTSDGDVLTTYFVLIFFGLPVIGIGYAIYAGVAMGGAAGRYARKRIKENDRNAGDA